MLFVSVLLCQRIVLYAINIYLIVSHYTSVTREWGDDIDKSQEEQLRQNARQILRCLYQEAQLTALREDLGKRR